MPQVAARISSEQEKWLKDYFRTKSAGAEFILPWAVDTFFRAVHTVKEIFSAPELKTIVEAHKDLRLLPENTRLVQDKKAPCSEYLGCDVSSKKSG